MSEESREGVEGVEGVERFEEVDEVEASGAQEACAHGGQLGHLRAATCANVAKTAAPVWFTITNRATCVPGTGMLRAEPTELGEL